MTPERRLRLLNLCRPRLFLQVLWGSVLLLALSDILAKVLNFNVLWIHGIVSAVMMLVFMARLGRRWMVRLGWEPVSRDQVNLLSIYLNQDLVSHWESTRSAEGSGFGEGVDDPFLRTQSIVPVVLQVALIQYVQANRWISWLDFNRLVRRSGWPGSLSGPWALGGDWEQPALAMDWKGAVCPEAWRAAQMDEALPIASTVAPSRRRL